MVPTEAEREAFYRFRSYRPRARTTAERAAKHLESKLKSREEKESVRWIDGIREAETRVGADVVCIHVMDQEADNFAILADLIEAGGAVRRPRQRDASP
jgi:hypothetical protein